MWVPDGQRIASASGMTVQVWDANTGQHLITYTGHMGRVRAIAWSPDGQRMILMGSRAQVLEVDTGDPITDTYGESAESVAWAPDGQHIACVNHHGTVRVYEADLRNSLTTYLYEGRVGAIAWILNGWRVALASYDGTVQVW